MNIFQKILDGADLLIAGMLGAIVALAAYTEVKTVKQRIYFVGSGSASAYYLADLILSVFHLTNADGKFQTAMGFLIGIFGAAVCQAVVRAIKTADLVDLLKNILSRGVDKIFERLDKLFSRRDGDSTK